MSNSVLRLNLKLEMRRVPGDRASLVPGMNEYKVRVNNLEEKIHKVETYETVLQQ